jgi:hypothetical protein
MYCEFILMKFRNYLFPDICLREHFSLFLSDEIFNYEVFSNILGTSTIHIIQGGLNMTGTDCV